MISHGKDMKIFTGNANPALARRSASSSASSWARRRSRASPTARPPYPCMRPSRGSDVFLINSTCKPVNDSLMELLIMIDACKARPRGPRHRDPLFRLCTPGPQGQDGPNPPQVGGNMPLAAGADRVLTMDLHASQIRASSTSLWTTCWATPCSVDYYAKKFGESARTWWWCPPTWAVWPAPAPSPKSCT